MPKVSIANNALPDCDGPQLRPFTSRKVGIKFQNLLGGETSGTGGHAHVFEVSIGGRTYALKVFKFYDASVDVGNMTEREQRVIPKSLVQAHMDPFYNECRAYGKLIEANLNGNVAVRCHGYLTLSARIEQRLDEQFGHLDWDRPDQDTNKPLSKRQPLNAVVKDLIRDDISFAAKHVAKMLRDLKKIRRLGVYQCDMAARNYRAGLLVDFSSAITEPHYLFETRALWEVNVIQSDDLLDFDQMIEDAGLCTSIVGLREGAWRERDEIKKGHPNATAQNSIDRRAGDVCKEGAVLRDRVNLAR
ncbi:uncharacterized protein KY384_001378 [Bacidia gigantensis]|uniref:uncharacterized protein n=1 Tax=Bacidia gigantensis TaxID=2732470 RepID=UPI001D045BB7|nr:uncharacterized protein KY384_001378 [Bacidia gigantensis]KAG8533637.1 hypothetical protein KY384_001378 [Bacidia gigantensis]